MPPQRGAKSRSAGRGLEAAGEALPDPARVPWAIPAAHLPGRQGARGAGRGHRGGGRAACPRRTPAAAQVLPPEPEPVAMQRSRGRRCRGGARRGRGWRRGWARPRAAHQRSGATAAALLRIAPPPSAPTGESARHPRPARPMPAYPLCAVPGTKRLLLPHTAPPIWGQKVLLDLRSISLSLSSAPHLQPRSGPHLNPSSSYCIHWWGAFRQRKSGPPESGLDFNPTHLPLCDCEETRKQKIKQFNTHCWPAGHSHLLK